MKKIFLITILIIFNLFLLIFCMQDEDKIKQEINILLYENRMKENKMLSKFISFDKGITTLSRPFRPYQIPADVIRWIPGEAISFAKDYEHHFEHIDSIVNDIDGVKKVVWTVNPDSEYVSYNRNDVRRAYRLFITAFLYGDFITAREGLSEKFKNSEWTNDFFSRLDFMRKDDFTKIDPKKTEEFTVLIFGGLKIHFVCESDEFKIIGFEERKIIN